MVIRSDNSSCSYGLWAAAAMAQHIAAKPSADIGLRTHRAASPQHQEFETTERHAHACQAVPSINPVTLRLWPAQLETSFWEALGTPSYAQTDRWALILSMMNL